jgi:hypothetical protein
MHSGGGGGGGCGGGGGGGSSGGGGGDDTENDADGVDGDCDDDDDKAHLDNYDKIHSTWVCTQALRDRDFKIQENFRWVQWMERLLKTTRFGVLNYTPTWAVRRTEFSYDGLTYALVGLRVLLFA